MSLGKHIHAIWGSVLLCSAVTSWANEYDRSAVPVYTPPPEYPANLQEKHVEGVVVLLLTISNRGRVTEAVIQESSEPRLDKFARTAVFKWQFRPALRDDQPVETTLTVPVEFKLHQ